MKQTIVRVIGSAQDGGVPQLGCSCERCNYARASIEYTRYPASLAIVSPGGKLLLIDATPSLPQQLDLLQDLLPSRRSMLPDAVLLTHAHVGHYAGLIFFGREVASVKKLPVYCTERMKCFLELNKPYSYLIERGEIAITAVKCGEALSPDGKLHITPIEVPHRNEDTETVAFMIKSERSLFYAPDFDRYSEAIDRCVRDSDISMLDGCFWSREELHGRVYEEIPHPTIVESRERLRGYEDRVIFTHINHTNPVLNLDCHHRAELERQGFRIARERLDIIL
jgi:pyrroloquinoline quinone biosynthesis protein B